MAYALCPDDGLPRLWRFVGAEALPDGTLATLDVAQNLLVINRQAFELLLELDQHRLLRTHATQTDYIVERNIALPVDPAHRVRA